jgi:hypothetical protein
MASEQAMVEAAPIMPGAAADAALTKLCPDLQSWPQRWRCQDSDIVLGERLLECFTPFLLHLLEQGLAPKTLRRHRDHLWMLGGEIIRRVYERPALRRRSAPNLILQFMDPECGPLIWPRITRQQQDSFDATCRKLYQFLTAKPKPPAP